MKKVISPMELRNLLSSMSGAHPVSITTITDAKAKKTDNPYGTILKLSRVNGFIGANYATAVNRQRMREGSLPFFEAEERTWGTRINPYLVEHKGEYYLTLKVERALQKPMYMYQNQGLKLIDEKKIRKFLPEKRKAENQGLEKDVIVRDYKLSSIVTITVNKKTYKIR